MPKGGLGIAMAVLGALLGAPSIALGQSECSVPAAESGWDAYRSSDLIAARAIFEERRERCAPALGATIGLGYVELREGRNDTARQLFTEALRLSPANGDALKGMARVDARTGDVAAAEANWLRVLTNDSADVEALVGLSQTARWQGRLAESLGWIDRAAAVDPGSNAVIEEREWLAVSLGPTVTSRAGVESDSDGNHMYTLSGTARWRPLATTEVRFDSYLRLADLRGDRKRAAIGHAVSTSTSLASGWTVRGGLGGSETNVLGTGVVPMGFLGLMSPGGRTWSLAGELRNDPFDVTAPTIERSVRRRAFNAEARVHVASRLHLASSASGGEYVGTTSNAFWRSSVEMTHRGRVIQTGARVRAFGFAHDRNDGYFDPSRFIAIDAPARFEREAAPWGVRAEVAPGLQRSTRSDAYEASLSGRITATYRVRPGREMWLDAGWARSGAERLAAGSGSYTYRSIATGVTWTF